MKSFFEVLRKFKFPTKQEVTKAIHSLSKRDLFIVLALFLVVFVTTILLLARVNKKFTTTIPTEGGSLHEGIIGTPRFVNPVLALTDADKDMTRLVYSGLMRKSADGTFIPDLAESYSISNDQLTYTFILRDNALFHDGAHVTADDILFTITTIQDPIIKSGARLNWEGVEVKKIDSRTISFKLKQPYASFIENTTIGILPSHVWSTIPNEQFSFSDFNINAIGSGPYRINDVNKKSSGVIESYTLKSFSRFTLGKPYISKITFRFYANETELVRAIEGGVIDAAGALSGDSITELNIKPSSIKIGGLGRTFGLFFNTNNNDILKSLAVRQALELGISKQFIIDEILKGYGTEVNAPYFNSLPKNITQASEAEFAKNLEAAKNILTKEGWVENDDGFRYKTIDGTKKLLSISISTSNASELKRTAEYVKEFWGELGVQVELKVFEIGNLNQTVIRPRNYEVLFFGQVVRNESDLYAFWHSSQRSDPGLNISLYSNNIVDSTLEKLLKTGDQLKQREYYEVIQKEITKDLPAIFLYSPEYIYVMPKRVKGISLGNINEGSDRFNQINDWHIYTDNLWNIFNKTN
jgi:peptide/nickel transport system substrate-binding protein